MITGWQIDWNALERSLPDAAPLPGTYAVRLVPAMAQLAEILDMIAEAQRIGAAARGLPLCRR